MIYSVALVLAMLSDIIWGGQIKNHFVFKFRRVIGPAFLMLALALTTNVAFAALMTFGYIGYRVLGWRFVFGKDDPATPNDEDHALLDMGKPVEILYHIVHAIIGFGAAALVLIGFLYFTGVDYNMGYVAWVLAAHLFGLAVTLSLSSYLIVPAGAKRGRNWVRYSELVRGPIVAIGCYILYGNLTF